MILKNYSDKFREKKQELSSQKYPELGHTNQFLTALDEFGRIKKTRGQLEFRLN